MKRAERALLTILFLGALSLPFAIVFGGRFDFNGVSIAVRLLALSAFTLIFVQIITGALMQQLLKVFRPKRIWFFHRYVGEAAFVLVVGHATIVLLVGTFHAGGLVLRFLTLWRGYDALHRVALILGPVNLTLITLTVITALLMRALRKYWRTIHYLNYLIFAIVIFHGLLLGTDTGASWLVKALFIVYGALAAAVLGWRLAHGPRRHRGAKTAVDGSAAKKKPEGAPAGEASPA